MYAPARAHSAQITIPFHQFQDICRKLVVRGTNASPLPLTAGTIAHRHGFEVVCAPAYSNQDGECWIGLTDFSRPMALPTQHSHCLSVVLVGTGAHQGKIVAAMRLPSGSWTSAESLFLPGPGMHRIAVTPTITDPLQDALALADGDMHLPLQSSREEAMADMFFQERYSRTIAALGIDTFRRLIDLKIGLIGAGRLGTRIAEEIVRHGGRHLTIVDPDTVEQHNLGESALLTDGHLGMSKAEALVQPLQAIGSSVFGPVEINALQASFSELGAIEATRECDLRIVCVDNDSARLIAALVCVADERPLLDIATGIHGHGAEQVLGADIRLVLPDSCLLCAGGLSDPTTAVRAARSARAESAFQQSRDWQSERAGSLASLNAMAAGVGLHMLQDLVSGRITQTQWCQMRFDSSGRLTTTYPELERPKTIRCPLCRQRGCGDAIHHFDLNQLLHPQSTQ